jgi:hypothetical protein
MYITPKEQGTSSSIVVVRDCEKENKKRIYEFQYHFFSLSLLRKEAAAKSSAFAAAI